MNAASILGTSVFLVLGAVWYAPAMLWGYQVSSAMDDIQSGDVGALAKLAEGPAPLAWLRNKAELRNTYSLDEINLDRRVAIQVNIPLADLLKNGEAMPEPELHDLYAAARAPMYFQSYCHELLEGFASKCGVLRSEGNASSDDTVTISATLGYVPAYEIGTLDNTENGDVTQIRLRLEPEDRLPATAESRERMTNVALDLCTELKKTHGNCLIGSLSFTQRDRNDESHYHVSSVITVYADKSQFSRATLTDQAEEILADLL